MRYAIRCIGVIGILALVILTAGGADGDSPPDIGTCGACHDATDVKFQTTMCLVSGEGFPTCETCHTNAATHAEEGDPELVGKPSGEEQDTLCRTCHAGPAHTALGGSVHSDAGVHCDSCHQVHPDTLHPRRLLRAEPDELCAECHPAEQRAFDRPFGHRLERAGMDCVSCHNPHGGSGERSLARDRSGDGPCVTCHAEKRGPFVFPHVEGFAGDCTSCHEAHGSSNRRGLIRARVDQLCLECHSPIVAGTLGSQTPSFHDTRFPRYRQCTVCHVAVHGSNSSPELLR